MANAVKVSARRALLDAAKALLPRRAASTISGRELAAEAGVNYGLVHHHFGGKDEVFRAALLELREEFLATHTDHDLPALLIEPDDPYVLAVARSQIGAGDVVGIGDFPIGDAMVSTLVARLAASQPTWTAEEIAIDAKARAIAMLSMQLAYSVYNDLLLRTMGVTRDERAAVEATLGRVYGEVARSR